MYTLERRPVPSTASMARPVRATRSYLTRPLLRRDNHERYLPSVMNRLAVRKAKESTRHRQRKHRRRLARLTSILEKHLQPARSPWPIMHIKAGGTRLATSLVVNRFYNAGCSVVSVTSRSLQLVPPLSPSRNSPGFATRHTEPCPFTCYSGSQDLCLSAAARRIPGS